MTVFSAVSPRSPRTRTRAHFVPIVLGGVFAASAIALVAYLLWPTWGTGGANAPDKLPVSVGGTLFNLPAAAIRMKIQRHSGPQERIDLDFLYPSLEPPGAPKHVDRRHAWTRRCSRSTASSCRSRRITMRSRPSSARHDLSALSRPGRNDAGGRPDDADVPQPRRPMAARIFYSAASPALTARCTRDAATPGMACPSAASAAPTSPSAFRAAGCRNGAMWRRRWTG